MEWIESHLLFCIFALIVFVLVITIILVLVVQRKKEDRLKSRKGIALKKSDLNKKKEKQESIGYQKPIIKQNLRTGEKVDRNAKAKTKKVESEKVDEQENQTLMVVKAKKVKNPKYDEFMAEEEKKRLEKEKALEEQKAKKEAEAKAKQEKIEKQKLEKEKAEAQKAKDQEKKEKEKRSLQKKKVVMKQVVKKEAETYRVVYDKEQRNWIVKIDGGERASKRCATKEEALKVARDLAKKKDADLSVHKKNGKFQKQ